MSIGMHYVAVNATDLDQGLPQDWDDDGIPDYVENWHGDGDYPSHTDTETDWQNPETDQLTSDPYNAVYDDIDLSGNGLVGRIKAALNLDPLDSNPLRLTQVSSDHEPDIVSFKVGRDVDGQFLALDYDLLSSIGGLRLNWDGFDVAVEACARATDGNDAVLSWNTTYEPPGLHLLQPRLTLNGTGVDSAILSGLGLLVPFYSDNVCRFFECDSMFDDYGAYLDAQLPLPNATYTIRLYDPSTSTLLKTIGPHSTSSGMIQEDWLLDCDQGPSPFAGSTFNAVFDITLLGEDGSTPIAHGTPTEHQGKINTTVEGNGFDVAYMYTPRDNTLVNSFAQDGQVWIGMQGVVDALTQPEVNPGHYDSSFNWFTSWDHLWGKPGYLSSMATVTGFLYPSMSDGLTKNFYCYAHGSADTLGNYAGDVTITVGEVAAHLGNTGLPGFPFPEPPGNPYRFVFLDGCLTASDQQWRHAFGIMPLGPPGQAPRSKLEAQAFVGWASLKPDLLGGIPEKGDIDVEQSRALQSAYAATLQFFFSEWMNGETLVTCIAEASNPGRVQCPIPSCGVNRITISSPYASSPFEVDFEDQLYKFTKLWIYGHPGLTRSGLKSDEDYSVPGYQAPGNTD